MVTLAFAQVWWGRAKRGLALSFGLLWFAVALSPATGIIFPVNALMASLDVSAADGAAAGRHTNRSRDF